VKSLVRWSQVLLLASIVAAVDGCKSTDGAASSSAIMYDDPFLDAWYYGDYCDDPDIIVTPPDRPTDPPKPTHPIVVPPESSVEPSHPIATPPMPRPTPMPSIPRMPMPRVRAR
jgi:hypothetical protein